MENRPMLSPDRIPEPLPAAAADYAVVRPAIELI